MRTLIIAKDKSTMKAIGKILRKAEIKEYTFERRMEDAMDVIRDKEISLVIIDSLDIRNKDEREEKVKNLLYEMLFEEIFPQVIILTKEPLPEEYIPIENCCYVGNLLQLKFKMSRIKQ